MNQVAGTAVQIDALGRIHLAGYPARKPFASFLPGISGSFGIPMWAFYVNRGQGIASFGVQNKDNPILEFLPANKAYQLTPLLGFRTFLSIRNDGKTEFVEPFSPARPASTQHMWVGMGELEIQDSDPASGWQVTVNYSGLHQEPFGALLRQVTLHNTAAHPLQLDLLDGLPAVQSFGVNNWLLKELGRTVEAWMEVYNIEGAMPFYRLRASVADTEQVERYTAGHFYLPFQPDVRVGSLPIIIDPRAIFGSDTTFMQPHIFMSGGLKAVGASPQVGIGRTPCAFSGLSVTLQPGEQVCLASAFGHAGDESELEGIRSRLTTPGFLSCKLAESRAFFTTLTDAIDTRTAAPLFDGYLRQSYLDNLIRGGQPLVYGEPGKRKVFHLYSRKHGDLERDYNAFQVNPEMFSQGNANYRDINQNRRCDVFFNPAVEDFSILTFLNLIQLDGYNPLVLTGMALRIPEESLPGLLAMSETPDQLRPLLTGSFTPGALLRCILHEGVALTTSLEDFIGAVMQAADFEQQADFHEGFWVDHWTYNLDMIDAFLAVYPERQQTLFFERTVTWFESPVSVQPRRVKLVHTDEGLRQYGAVQEDAEKAARIAARRDQASLARDSQGSILHTTVFNKLFFLALIKAATLDPSGVGIEMEAGRPGWYDALNGLPGLLGSSLNETHALARLVAMLQDALPLGGDAISLPVEQIELMHRVHTALKVWASGGAMRDAHFWETCVEAREAYREQTRFGLDGRCETVTLAALGEVLEDIQGKLRIAIESGSKMPLPDGQDLPPTYLVHTLAGGEPAGGSLRFDSRALPAFLEGVVNAMRTCTPTEAPELHARLMRSSLYDQKLGMLRVNASLAGEPHAIGRVRAFPPGWLENESIWTHMSYKYLLEMIRKGLHAEFFEAVQCQMPPFIDPETYGRSPLELSSFIASSAHPDPSLHGAGFVARLSGATAETLSMWWEIFTGGQPFRLRDGQLSLALRPVLPAWLFDEKDEVAFRFLGHTRVTIHNTGRKDLLGAQRPGPLAYHLSLQDGGSIALAGAEIPDPYARMVRDGSVSAIHIEI